MSLCSKQVLRFERKDLYAVAAWCGGCFELCVRLLRLILDLWI